VAFKVWEKFNAAVPQQHSLQAFDHLNILWKIMKAIHSLESDKDNTDTSFSKIIRRSMVKEQDFIDPKVYTLTL